MKELGPKRLNALLLLLLLGALPCPAQSAGAGEAPLPVRRRAPSAGSNVECSGFEFQRPYLGYEGPNFTALDGEPSAGARYLVKADLFWQEPPATVKFELVDAAGRSLGPLRLSKSDTSPEDGPYFTVDLAPSFVGQNATKTKFCVAEDYYTYKSKPRRVWEELLASTSPVGYKIYLYKAGYAGETGPFHPPGSFYEGHRREGAVECKPYMNRNF